MLIVAGEIRAESLEPGELGDLVRIVAGCSAQVGELVQLIYGRSCPEPQAAEVER